MAMRSGSRILEMCMMTLSFVMMEIKFQGMDVWEIALRLSRTGHVSME